MGKRRRTAADILAARAAARNGHARGVDPGALRGDAWEGGDPGPPEVPDPPPPPPEVEALPPPWDEPIPVATDHAPPPFPTDMLPGCLARWVAAEAEATQTPADLAGSLPWRLPVPAWPASSASLSGPAGASP